MPVIQTSLDLNSEAARANREGENGKARAELRRRLDARQTDWHRVMTGADTHWSAVQVRAEIVKDVDRGVAAARAQDPDFAQEMDDRLARRRR